MRCRVVVSSSREVVVVSSCRCIVASSNREVVASVCRRVVVSLCADAAVVDTYDYVFSENGLTAYRMGQQLDKASFIKHVGEEEYKKLVNWILRYLSDVDIPVKR
jgi:hypothetical protein